MCLFAVIGLGLIWSIFGSNYDPNHFILGIEMTSKYNMFFLTVYCLVELVIETVIYNHLQIDHQQNLSTRDFILKVYDKSEYLLK